MSTRLGPIQTAAICGEKKKFMPRHLSISIVIPTYNREKLIKRAIQSVLSQCEPGDEIIVVDDGSTDNTEQVVSEYPGQVRYFRIKNSGAGVARNRGILESKNDLVAFLDSDDEWMPGKLSLQRCLMSKRQDVLFCFSNFSVKSLNGSESGQYLENWHTDRRPWIEILNEASRFSEICDLPETIEDFNVYVGDLYHSLAANLYVFTGTVMARRKEAEDALQFGTDMPTYEDWICYGKLAGKGLAAYMDCETAWQHGHQQSRLTDANELETSTARIKVLQQVWGCDSNFLADNPDYFKTLINKQRTIHAIELMAIGKSREARSDLKEVRPRPVLLSLLAILPPGNITSTAVRYLRAVKRFFNV